MFLKRICPLLCSAAITALAVYILLDAFVIARPAANPPQIDRNPSITFPPPSTKAPSGTTTGKTVSAVTEAPDNPGTDTALTEPPQTDPPQTEPPQTEPPIVYPIIGDLYYKDENIEITIEKNDFVNKKGVSNRIFIVDLRVSDVEYLRTAFANNTYGNKVTQTTSALAAQNHAIFAINGDYYGFRKNGFVLRNYTLYRDTPRSSEDDDALVVYGDGSLYLIDENNIQASALPYEVYQVFSFGPRLVENGEISASANSEVTFSMTSNPRTAIGMVEPHHYKIVVSEGRLVKDDGLTLAELAGLMKNLGCSAAYNLDGGSSTTLYFNGKILNQLSETERNISDIIYINGKSYSDEK